MKAEAALKSFLPDFILWSDGSVLANGNGASACISYKTCLVPNPYNKGKLCHYPTLCIVKPGGRLCNPTDVEVIGLDSALEYSLSHRESFINKQVLIATDS